MTEPEDPSAETRPAAGRNVRRLAALLVAAVLIGLLAAWLSRGEFKGRYAIPAAGHDTAAVAPPAPAKHPVAKPRPIVPASPPALSPTTTDDNDAAPEDDDDRQRIGDAIEQAARKALDRGEPVHWHKAGESGYVVVSEARDTGGRTCRNVSATIDGDGGQTQSNSRMWCMSDEDGDWEPEQ